MRLRSSLITSGLALCCTTIGTSQAAEVVVHEHNAYAQARVYRDGDYRLAPRDRLTVHTDGPVVYGWSFRPANCGVFHYWNGDECVDARTVPPAQ